MTAATCVIGLSSYRTRGRSACRPALWGLLFRAVVGRTPIRGMGKLEENQEKVPLRQQKDHKTGKIEETPATTARYRTMLRR